MRIALTTIVAIFCGVELGFAAAGHDSSMRVTAPVVHKATPPRPRPAPARPPQFITVGFDGSGGIKMWRYWLAVAKETHAQFTFFVSGVYLLDWAHQLEYRPPHHRPGTSAIGFAQTSGDLTIANTLTGIIAGYRAGQEIGTHYNGHFCLPDRGSVGYWTGADWASELRQFNHLLFGTGTKLPFGPSEIVGSRSPCLEGKPKVLYPVLAKHGLLYDTSETARLGTWPHRELGIWSYPLLEIPFVGHTFRVISMDYNFFANQVDESPAQAEDEAYQSLWNAFRASYFGERAPLSIGHHFETWKSEAYDQALSRFLVKACALPEVRCVGYHALTDFLDSLPAGKLKRYETGKFPRLKRSQIILAHL